MTAREAAFRSLLRIGKESRYSNLETDLTLKKGGLTEVDARFYTRLVYACIERKLTLDHHLSARLDTPMDKLDREVAVILRLGACQILYFDRVPDSAAVNESVILAKKYRKSAASLVNAVLRRLSAEKDALTYPDEESDPVRRLSAYYSVSEPVCARFLREFGRQETEAFFSALSPPPATALRVNTLKTDRGALARLLMDRGIEPSPSPLFPCALRVPAASELPSFEEGLFFVQDEASQAAVASLDARPGMTVMDLCACPGGKSFGAALCMENKGEILSFDLHANKLPLIEQGARRLGITIIRAAAGDARVFLPEWEARADRVLVDAPCSGFGVMAKKPEIRYKDLGETERLPGIQSAILMNAARYVKPGGRLIYSTCTVFARENGEVVDGFLASHPDFEEDDLRLPTLAPGQCRVTLLPQVHHTDGFFICAMKRKER